MEARRILYIDPGIDDRTTAVRWACPELPEVEAARVATEIDLALRVAPIEHRCVIGKWGDVVECYFRRVEVERPGLVFVMEIRE
jgi:hypothetical protein